MKLTMRMLVYVMILFIWGCSESNKIATIEFDPSIADIETLTFFSIDKDKHQMVSAEEPSFELILDAPVILSAEHRYTYNYVYVEPGLNIHLDTISTAPLRLKCSDCGVENDYLNRYNQLLFENNFRVYSEADVDFKSYTSNLNEHFVPFDSLINLIETDGKLNPYFKLAMVNRNKLLKGNKYIEYSGTHEYISDTVPNIPTDYLSTYNKMDLTASDLLIFEEGRNFLQAWYGTKIDYQSFASLKDYFDANIAAAQQTYGTSLVGEYCHNTELIQQLNFGGGIDYVISMADAYKQNAQNQFLITKLDNEMEPWLKLTKNSPAPNFKAYTRDGDQVMLSDLKGKRIYVDVWATWCGPCIREIPALKALEEELHADVEFVSVSIDKEADKEKWLEFLTEKDLQGTQLMAEGDWKSDVVLDYNIQGIPRFFIVDSEGKILNSNAPRPSSEGIRDALLN